MYNYHINVFVPVHLAPYKPIACIWYSIMSTTTSKKYTFEAGMSRYYYMHPIVPIREPTLEPEE